MAFELKSPSLSETRAVLSISQLTTAIKGRLEADFPAVWVRGEVSNFRAQSSGHFYFTLKDERAQLPTVMFRGDTRALKFQIEDGQSLIVFGRITVYEPHGRYQIIIARAEPDGAGALQLAFEQLKKKLAVEGLFATERKRPLPFLPRRVGIITSPQGAAIRDMLKILRERHPLMDVLIYPVRVQGEGAASEIVQAINWFSKTHTVDTLVIGRGGGSIEDLWAFNEEIVARAVAACAVPVISAVGHETDFTICDFVADVRAATPTAAAQMAVPYLDDLQGSVKDARRSLVLSLQGFLGDRCKDLQILVHRLPTPRHVFDRIQLQLADLEDRLIHEMRDKLYGFKEDVSGVRLRLKSPTEILHVALSRLQDQRQALLSTLREDLLTKAHRLATAQAQLTALSPLGVLQRGYAIVQDSQGRALIGRAAAAREERLNLRFHDGALAVKKAEA